MRKFKRGGLFTSKEKKTIKFKEVVGLNSKPCIYLWVIKSNLSKLNNKVIYVGKGGKGLKKRMQEHEGGFKGREKGGSKSGKRKNDILLEILNPPENNITIYYKEAEPFLCENKSYEFLNLNSNNFHETKRFKNLTFFSFEEEYYIKLYGVENNDYKPPLNGRLNDDDTFESLISENPHILRNYFED